MLLKKFWMLAKNMREKIKVGAILITAFILRIFRIDQLLGFYFDQGRDAKVIWDLIYNHKFFLIGPTTGIEGIFRGPWYYWLITPFYWLGHGNPVYPSVFLSLTTVIALFFAYKIAEKIGGKISGLLTVFIGGFSYTIVMASRWLSNPTPMFLISMVFLYSFFMILDGKKWAWVITGLFAGLAMQFGSATEIFYFPALLIFIFWQRKNLPNRKIILLSIIALLITIIPQIIFDFKHDHILSNNIYKFIFSENSFKLSFWEIIKVRIPFYYSMFSLKLFPNSSELSKIFISIFAILLIVQRKILFKNKNFLIVLIFLTSPLIGMLFFQGNEGNVYDYYFTGYYLIFIVLFAIVYGTFWKHILGKILIISFVLLFAKENLSLINKNIIFEVDGPNSITLEQQTRAIDWVYKNSRGASFNVDVYVPPVITHAYDYLFLWLGTTKYHKLPNENNISLLYTLYEVDPPHPERLDAWLKRQKGIGKIAESVTFAGITVEKRTRIK